MKANPLFIALGLLSACSAVPEAPEDVVASVEAALNQGDGHSFSRQQVLRFMMPVKLSGARQAWLVDFGRSGDFAWCGTGGCTHQLWAADQGGYRLVFDQEVRDVRLRTGEPTLLDIEIHGSHCGLAGSSICRRAYMWDDRSKQFIETPNQDAQAYLVGPLFQVAPVDAKRIPAVIKADVERSHQACLAQGGMVEGADIEVASSPDLNGDGVRDWIVGSRESGCVTADNQMTGGVSVWVSKGEGWTKALALAEAGYAVDVSSNPARFGSRPDEGCREGQTCTTHFYVWRDGALVPA